MNGLTVKRRLQVLAGISILAMVLVGTIGLTGMYISSTSVPRMQKQVDVVDRINHLFHIYTTVASNTMEDIYLEDIPPGDGTKLLESIVQDAETTWAAVYDSNTVDDRLLLDRVNAEITSLNSAVRKSVTLLGSGDLYEFGVFFNIEMKPSFELVTTLLQQLIVQEKNQADAEYRYVTRIQSNSLLMVTISVIVAALVLVFMFTSIAGGISSAVDTISASVGEIARGRLDGRVPDQWRDEFGVLARSFNHMTAQLQDLYSNLEDKVADRTARLQLVAGIGESLNSLEDEEAIYERTVQLLSNLNDLAGVAIYTMDSDGSILAIRAEKWDSELSAEPAQSTIDANLDHRVARAARNRMEVSDVANTDHTFNYISMPVRHPEDGTLLCVLDACLRREVDEGYIDMLQSVGNYLSGAMTRIESARAKEQARREWETTFHAMRDGVALVNGIQELLVANDTFREIQDISTSDPGTASLQECIQTIMGRQERDISPPVEYQIQGRTYEVTAVRVSSAASADGPSGKTVLNFHDISSRKRSELALQEYAQKLHESNQNLEEFAYVASHDLQEPLRKVLVFGERLDNKYGDAIGDSGRNYLHRMMNAAQRMQGLIKGLLAYSRISSSDDKIEPVDLAEIVREVMSDLEVRIEELNAEVNIDALPVIEGNALQMRQLFQNIIGNALKFHLPDVRPRVDVTAEAETLPDGGRRWQMAISDNGIGFDSKHADTIFGVFSRLHSNSSNYHGSGIGLAVCKKIVERHGGRITAASSPGEGACFHIVLPEKQENSSSEAAHPPRWKTRKVAH